MMNNPHGVGRRASKRGVYRNTLFALEFQKGRRFLADIADIGLEHRQETWLGGVLRCYRSRAASRKSRDQSAEIKFAFQPSAISFFFLF